MVAFVRCEVGSPETTAVPAVANSLEGQNMNYLKLPLVVLLSIAIVGLLAIVPYVLLRGPVKRIASAFMHRKLVERLHH